MYLIIDQKQIKVIEAKTFKQKLLGFMFKKNFSYGLRFKTKSIHTFFMKERIDVVQTDKNNKIIYYYLNLKRMKIIWPKKKVYYTYEFPNNTFKNINIGDYLSIED